MELRGASRGSRGIHHLALSGAKIVSIPAPVSTGPGPRQCPVSEVRGTNERPEDERQSPGCKAWVWSFYIFRWQRDRQGLPEVVPATQPSRGCEPAVAAGLNPRSAGPKPGAPMTGSGHETGSSAARTRDPAALDADVKYDRGFTPAARLWSRKGPWFSRGPFGNAARDVEPPDQGLPPLARKRVGDGPRESSLPTSWLPSRPEKCRNSRPRL
jgi:hypothetical protein